ncbi:hypothetical protein BG011_003280 [Mortierella polycephala]|uniref:DUF202 domain-containing protein n=1 Tax=Mortierella polycephala TaxID=41804 RepID=A0A9P6Q4R8_9FUNG|nr:hypothetical protein BG011_003280 [Mortierella polycephala]
MSGPNIPSRASSSTMTLVNSPSRSFFDNSGSAFSSPPASPGAYRGSPLPSNSSISPPASPAGYRGPSSPRHVTSDGGRGAQHPGQPSQPQRPKPRQQHQQYRPPQTHYRSQRQYRPPQPTSSPAELASDHPLELTPPNPKFAHSMNANNHPGSNHNSNDSHLRVRSPHPPVGRPDSVVSTSSTHSNEPLNQPLKSRKPAQKTMMPRKPIAAVVTNPSSLSRGMNSIDLNDNKDKSSRRLSVSSVASFASGKKKKSKLFSRMGKILRGPRPYNPQKYKMAGMGKVSQFSNERLYLHWIRFGVLQGMIAVTLLSFGIGVASYVGVGALVLAMLTLVYGTQLYHTRHIHMIKKRKDAKFFARTIPTLLTLGLFGLYAGNFIITMTYGDEARSPPPWTQYEDGFHYF